MILMIKNRVKIKDTDFSFKAETVKLTDVELVTEEYKPVGSAGNLEVVTGVNLSELELNKITEWPENMSLNGRIPLEFTAEIVEKDESVTPYVIEVIARLAKDTKGEMKARQWTGQSLKFQPDRYREEKGGVEVWDIDFKNEIYNHYGDDVRY